MRAVRWASGSQVVDGGWQRSAKGGSMDVARRIAKARARLGGLCLVLALVAAACSDSEPTGQDSAATGDIGRGGSVVLAVNGSLTGFNWHVSTSASNVLDSLMANVWPSPFKETADGGLVLNRELLESTEVTSTAPQTVVYKINPKAVWSDGEPVDAGDFVYLWRTAYTPGAKDLDGKDIASTDAGSAGVIESVAGSDNDKTVTVVFSRPYADWQSLFRHLVPAHAAERVGWNHGFDNFDPAVVLSAGPFRISSYNPDRDLTLVRNERYWGTPANLDSIVMRFLPDPGQVAAAVRNREVDAASAFGSSVDLVDQLRAVPQLATPISSMHRLTRIVFNVGTPALATPEVRRAIALALDRPGMVARTTAPLDASKARIANNRIFAPTEPGYTATNGRDFDQPDVAGARNILESAGFRRGPDGIYARGEERLSLRLLTGPVPPVAELVQAQAREAGIDIRIDTGAPVRQRAVNGDFDLWATEAPTWSSQKATTANFYVTGGGFNSGKYSNPTVDELFSQANAELDERRRTDLYNGIDAVLWDDMVTLPLYQSLGVIAYRENLANILLAPSGSFMVNAETWGRRVPR